ncbi:hypothetical protein FNF29_04115 [Cafeteria roenbergensis]|uniref:Uncharacterized protein n=1 Tax=Cafeteria roenbergensis TaxID=33653 RepID=A0A5A8CIP6_CAFRO|nr:hypothetical protein FNF29_04115 [Cafeteria roenbergensis]|eukprot:KAA0152000.1 hypothetical protein FNF29_04115 [Cafeteria roenbergensis]
MPTAEWVVEPDGARSLLVAFKGMTVLAEVADGPLGPSSWGQLRSRLAHASQPPSAVLASGPESLIAAASLRRSLGRAAPLLLMEAEAARGAALLACGAAASSDLACRRELGKEWGGRAAAHAALVAAPLGWRELREATARLVPLALGQPRSLLRCDAGEVAGPATDDGTEHPPRDAEATAHTGAFRAGALAGASL